MKARLFMYLVGQVEGWYGKPKPYLRGFTNAVGIVLGEGY
jgi:hypothetical protein